MALGTGTWTRAFTGHSQHLHEASIPRLFNEKSRITTRRAAILVDE